MTRPTTRPMSTRTSRYAIGRGTLLSLLAGRATYRLIQLLATVLLLPAWGAHSYGVFGAAIATFSWLNALVFTGPEKTVLKLLPRAPRTGPMITEAMLAVVWWLPLPLVAAFGLTLAFDGAHAPAVYVGVAAMQLGTGCTLLLIGLHRANGRPRTDSRTFLVMSVAQVALLAAAAAGLGPVGYVAAMTAVQAVLNAVLTATLGRPSLRIRHRRGFLRRIAWTALFMSGTEASMFLSEAVLFAILPAVAPAEEVARLFVVVIVWSAGVNLSIYLLRVYAPHTSLRLAGAAGPAGRERAARLAVAVAGFNLVWLVAVAVVLARAGSTGTPTAQIALWAVLLASRAPALAALVWAGYLLENTDATAARVTGLAAAAGLVIAAAVGWFAVPALGGTGVIVSLAAGELAQALVIALRGRHRAPLAQGGGTSAASSASISSTPNGFAKK